jgi:hypothetical protein
VKMSRRRLACSFAAIVVAVSLLTPLRSASEPVRLLVVPFESDDALGRNVSNVLNLQIWQTLRRAPTPNPRGLDFGDGEVYWDDEPLKQLTHEAAEAAAANEGAQLVLWGRAWRFGPSVVAQSYLSIRISGEIQAARLKVWKLTLRAGVKSLTIACDAPTLRYEFSPIQLRPEVVAKYSGTPAGLPMYADRSEARPIGYAGDEFKAQTQYSAEWAKITSGRKEGWVRLPELSTSRTEVVDFTAALIRVLRRDWEGAEQALGKVVENSHTPAAIRVDAHLLRAVAIDARGGDFSQDIASAERLNPLAHRVYSIMSRFARLARLNDADAAERRKQIDELESTINRRASVFPPDSEWLSTARNVVAELRKASPSS